MSKYYFMNMRLDVFCNRENVSKIIQRALNDKAIFYNTAPVTSIGQSLSIDLILDRIFNDSKDKQDFGPSVCMHYKSEWFNISFYSEKGMKVCVSLSCVPLHMNKYDGWECIDFDYYIRMLLDLLKGFPIYALETDIMY